MATVEEFKVKVTTQGVEQLDRLGKVSDTVRTKLSSLGTTIAGLAFGGFIQGAISAAERIDDLSNATGIAVGTLLGFERALDIAGGKAENAGRVIMSFYNAIEAANDGSLKVRDAFNKVGVSLDDLRNKSEADLLQQTVRGLSELEAGSERASIATTLLSRAFRSVDPKQFQQALATGDFSQLEKSVQQSAAAAERLQLSYKNLQMGALQAIQPIIVLMGDTEVGVEKARLAVYALGAVFAVAMGASLIRNIATINKALGVTAALSNLVGKGPVGLIAKLALLGGGAAIAATQLDDLMAANERLEKSMADGATPAPESGNAGRTQELDARQKAVLESGKRAAQNLADAQLQISLRSASEIERIELEMRNNIAKGVEEIRSKSDLSESVRAKEILSLVSKETEKSYSDIAKIRRDIDIKVATETMAQAEQDAKEMAAYYQQVDQARLQAFDQVDAIKKQTEELQGRFDLTQKILDLSTTEQERQTKLFDLEQQRKATLDAISKIKDLPNNERLRREQELNAEYEKRIDLINKEADARNAREQDFSAGIRESMKRYEESLTPLKQGQQMAESVFSSMGSALDKFVETGKFNFGDFAKSVIQDLIKIQLRAAATQLLSAAFGSFFPIPGKANGGPVQSGQPYIVGERGPELFMPNSAGTIVPNDKLSGGAGSAGGSTVNNYYTISAIDAKSVAQLFAENKMTLLGTVRQAEKELPFRGR